MKSNFSSKNRRTNIFIIGIIILASTTPLICNANPEIFEGSNSVKDSEGNIYRTVKIGEQEWLAENLRSTKFQNGSMIESAFIPNNKPENLLKYGRLYSWNDVVDKRNICPIGWRVASDEDWMLLEKNIGIPHEDLGKTGWRGKNDVAISLKESQPNSIFRKFDPTQINRYHFSARAAGVKIKNRYFTQGMYAEFWTTSSDTESKAYARTLAFSWWNSHKGEIRRAKLNKDYMFSVRCVKN